MSVALEDIWDTPADNPPSRPNPPAAASDDDGSPRPSKHRRSTQPLFHPDSDDDLPAARPSVPRTPSGVPEDLDAHFNFDDDDDPQLAELRPSLDTEQLQREAEAKYSRKNAPYTPHQVLPSSSPPRDGDGLTARWGAAAKEKEGEGEKKKRPQIKMDEARLLGPDGFPALMKQTKEFKPKGKGHEQADLNRLLQIYQFWSHKMYPKAQFRDNVNTVEKLCHSRRMHSAVSVWRDEAKGLINGKPPPLDDPVDLPSDEEDVLIPRVNALPSSRSSSPARSSPTPAARTTRVPPSHPPTSGSEMDDDFDIDDMLREAAERTAAAQPTAGPSTTSSKAAAPTIDDEMDDLEFWADLAKGAGNTEIDLTLEEPPTQRALSKPSAGPSTIDIDDDFDMDEDAWEALNDLETHGGPSKQPPTLASSKPTSGGRAPVDGGMTEEEEWDKEMYA